MGIGTSIYDASVNSIDDSIKSSVHSVANKIVFAPPKPVGIEYPASIKNIKIASKNGNMIDMIICKPTILRNTKLIIFSHGNASINEQMYNLLQMWSDGLGIPVVGYDYQGYGYSEGTCSEENCYDDQESVVNYCQQNYNMDICLVGQSLGTGIVMDHVAHHKWSNPVILISPYESILRVVRKENSTLFSPSARYDMFDTQDKTEDITCPVKIFHGEQDQLIGVEHSKNIFDALTNQKFQPTFIPNCGHNDILEKIKISDLAEVIFQ